MNLRELIRNIYDNTTVADPGELTALVRQQLPPESVGEALDQTLRPFVRQVIAERRTNSPSTNVRPLPGQSWASAGIREGWQRHLQDAVHVGDGLWKRLFECTYDDLVYAAEERAEQARRNAAQERHYRALASAVLEAGVDTFGELGAEAHLRLFGGAA